MVEFRLLGDVEVDVDGRVVDLGHLRQRCVLAALLVDANRVVPVGHLLDRVWADRPPQRAHGTLHSYLSRLRPALAEAGVGIIRQPGGYLLTADPMCVDLHRFQALVAQARAAPEPDAAARLFAAALKLWRGDAFSMLDTPWIGMVRAAAEAQRLAAELDLNDLELARGGHAALVGRVARSAASHPLDERLAGQLMLALVRCGRQAEALDAYRRLRARLVDELGADPGPPLQRLHRQILHNDPALTAPAATDPATGSTAPRAQPGRPPTVPARPATPHQVPAPPASFTGRSAELALLSTALLGPGDAGGGAVTATIGGAGGVGKTWLALRWAHDNRDRFPDGQLYVNMRGFDPGAEPVTPAVAVRGFLDALGVPAEAIPEDAQARTALYRSRIGGRRLLIVVDNARDSAQVLPLLPGGDACRVLVTSRHQLPGLLAGNGARPVPLDVLGDADAARLLRWHLGDARVTAEPAAVRMLVRRCAGLPLALGIIAARAALQPDLPLAALADDLADASTRLDALDAGELAVDLRAVLACSYVALPDEQARMFGLLGLVAGPDIGLPAAARLADLPPGRTRTVLRHLAGAHLVQEHSPGRYRMHDLVRLYAAEQGSRLGVEGDQAVRRLICHYLETARAAALLLNPHHREIASAPGADRPGGTQLGDRAQALAWFTAEHAVLLAAVEQAAATGAEPHAWRLAASLTTFLDWGGHWNDREHTQRVALAAACRVGDRAAEARSHLGLGIAEIWLGRHAGAEDQLRQALARFEELGDDDGLAHTYRNFARVSAVQGRHRAALPHDWKALSFFRATGDRCGQARTLNAIGWHLAHLGEPEQALVYGEQALALQQRIGNCPAEGMTWDSLGYIHRSRGDHQRAADCYRRASVLLREVGHRYFEALALMRLGDAQQALGEPFAARTNWAEAGRMLDDLHHPDAQQARSRLRPDVVLALDR